MAGEKITRRLAAILVADMVGYARLMAADEPGTLARFKALRGSVIDSAIATHDGRIFKTTGDGFLVEFHSVVDAVQCAIAIQRAMHDSDPAAPAERRIRFRIGVNIGDVIVDGDDIHGDGVNVAARLEGLAAPGGIAISSQVFDQIEGKIDAIFTGIGEHRAKNIARPIRVLAWSPDGVGDSASAIAAAALGRPPHELPVIAVLPFQVAGGNPQHAEIADGLADEIATALSRRTGIRVVPSAVSARHRGATDARQAGRDLDADYVLAGRIRIAGERCRVNAQMIEIGHGQTFWAEQYEHDVSDIFAAQDAITRSLDAALRVQINAYDARRLEGRAEATLSDSELLAKAAYHFYRMTTDDFRQARQLLDQVLTRSPRNAMALSMRAYSGVARRQFGLASRPDQPPDRLLELADQALDLQEASDFAHWVRGVICLYACGDHDGAIADARRALEINPSYMLARGLLGLALAFSGRPDEGIPHIEAAIAANRTDPLNGYRYWGLALAHFVAGAPAEAIRCAREATQRRAISPVYQAALAALLADAGDVDQARLAVETLRRRYPRISKSRLPDPPFRRAADRERYHRALVAAGMPE